MNYKISPENITIEKITTLPAPEYNYENNEVLLPLNRGDFYRFVIDYRRLKS